MEDNQFIGFINGKEELCEFIFTYYDESFKKDYAFFYILSQGITSVMEYIEDEEGEVSMKDIKSDEENKLLQEVFREYMESLE